MTTETSATDMFSLAEAERWFQNIKRRLPSQNEPQQASRQLQPDHYQARQELSRLQEQLGAGFNNIQEVSVIKPNPAKILFWNPTPEEKQDYKDLFLRFQELLSQVKLATQTPFVAFALEEKPEGGKLEYTRSKTQEWINLQSRLPIDQRQTHLVLHGVRGYLSRQQLQQLLQLLHQQASDRYRLQYSGDGRKLSLRISWINQ